MIYTSISLTHYHFACLTIDIIIIASCFYKMYIDVSLVEIDFDTHREMFLVSDSLKIEVIGEPVYKCNLTSWEDDR